MDLDKCYRGGRSIAPTKSRYIVHREFVLCARCVFHNSRDLHSLVAPGCLTRWHDAWDHSSKLVIGSREAVAHHVRGRTR